MIRVVQVSQYAGAPFNVLPKEPCILLVSNHKVPVDCQEKVDVAIDLPILSTIKPEVLRTAQPSVSCHLPGIAAYHGPGIEEVGRIVFGLDGPQPPVVGTVKILFPRRQVKISLVHVRSGSRCYGRQLGNQRVRQLYLSLFFDRPGHRKVPWR